MNKFLRNRLILCWSILLLASLCMAADQPAPAAPAAPAAKLAKWPADYPVTGDSVAVMSVSIAGKPVGDMYFEFYPDSAPNHVRNFKWLADHGFYDNVKFHRIIKGFMAQGGDPTGTGTSGPGWKVAAEFNGIPHTVGILSMARASDPNSAGSQFFIMDGTNPSLDHQYTVFGKLIKGDEVRAQMMDVELGGPQGSSPMVPVVMTSVKIIPRKAVK